VKPKHFPNCNLLKEFDKRSVVDNIWIRKLPSKIEGEIKQAIIPDQLITTVLKSLHDDHGHQCPRSSSKDF